MFVSIYMDQFSLHFLVFLIFLFAPGNRFVAVSDGLWDNGAACGRRYRVRCLSGPKKACRHKTIEVKVVDFCPVTPCPSTIVLPIESFAAIARRHTRKINVEYIQ